ncbi:MAG: hypothetical protein JRJ87_25335 [Deltaproteobacteria bacterium]|nr:hypothetical protein [Deltaproteobacteria bacterium]
MRIIIVIATYLIPLTSLAADLLPPLKKATEESVKAHCQDWGGVLTDKMCWCDFRRGGSLPCTCGGDSHKVDGGEWRVEGTHIKGFVGSKKYIKINWLVLYTSKKFIVWLDNNQAYKGKPRRRAEACGKERCDEFGGSTVKVLAGNSDRKLYKSVLKALPDLVDMGMEGLEGFVFFNEGKSKKARKVTEIWFKDGFKSEAAMLAEELEKTIGKITPKKWEWGGFYDLILIVGKEKA